MQDPRLVTEELEYRTLSRYAQKSRDSKGRTVAEKPCAIRTAFQRDRDRIIHSKAFRRLKHKTQVFLIPEGDHYRTRLTHTLEVAQIARTIARGLRLNEDLTEAIALGHDLGHTPFGHAGEQVLREILPGGFEHNEQSLRVVDVLEGPGGLNLTWEVRDGILNHCDVREPSTMEGQVVKLSDKMAYINHDIDDAIRGGILKPGDVPRECASVLGETHSERINTMVRDVIWTSHDRPEIRMSTEIGEATMHLRQFLFDEVYIDSDAKREEDKAMDIIRKLHAYYTAHPCELYEGKGVPPGTETGQAVADYIAGMTDRFAVAQYKEHFMPRPWRLEF
ncbi:MAG: deoxyguanosinetriphosphate triphosphohydrolase [Bacillota bacterium]|jgi:dGTPase|nr:deoxyguanosinetriphosphate triphosphohydrolase [Bacillota bacterium]